MLNVLGHLDPELPAGNVLRETAAPNDRIAVLVLEGLGSPALEVYWLRLWLDPGSDRNVVFEGRRYDLPSSVEHGELISPVTR